MRCKFRRLRVRDEARDGELNVDRETRARNQRMADRRQRELNGEPPMSEEEQAAMRRITHLSLLESYSKLIPVIKYKKNSKAIDEFNIPECTICMDPFVSGAKIRKIPSCKHFFHDECLMKWLSGSNQVDSQKCPLCNEDITVDLLEKAIEN